MFVQQQVDHWGEISRNETKKTKKNKIQKFSIFSGKIWTVLQWSTSNKNKAKSILKKKDEIYAIGKWC